MRKIYKINANWKKPVVNITAFTSLNFNGYSTNKSYADANGNPGLNFSTTVGDDIDQVLQNRTLLSQQINKPIVWLNQVHGVYCVDLDNINYFNIMDNQNTLIKADATFCSNNKVACAVLTADCLPLLVTDVHSKAVLSIHAGWRGLASGVIESSIEYYMQKTQTSPHDLLVWLGPAISEAVFEVGAEVKELFMQKALQKESNITNNCFILNIANKKFVATDNGNLCANLYTLAQLRLQRLGINLITQVSGGDFCTYFDQRLYSYRRSKITGRLVNIIYKN